MTDNRMNEPTEAMVEAAARVIWEMDNTTLGIKPPESLGAWEEETEGYLELARAVLVAAQEAAPRDSVMKITPAILSLPGRRRTMSDEYTPTTRGVTAYYCHARQEATGVTAEEGAHERFHAEFDRWLAEVERAAAEKALEEAADLLSEPRKLWYGDNGVEVLIDERTLEKQKLTVWLRARAEVYLQERKEQ